ncbi:MAG TPA: hypothetical protein VGM76_11295 [Lacipirellulaceae bacterium]|jgi:hypothetical protein
MSAADHEYIPGVCNIGSKEIAKRRVLGWIGLAASVVLWATLIFLKSAAAWRLFLFVPAVLSALGFLQAHRRFCVKHGFDGTFKFGPRAQKTADADQPDHRRKDRQTAVRIVIIATLIGIAVAAAAYFI